MGDMEAGQSGAQVHRQPNMLYPNFPACSMSLLDLCVTSPEPISVYLMSILEASRETSRIEYIPLYLAGSHVEW